MEDELMTPEEFAAKIKAKYPQYKDMDDRELVIKITDKYPEYNDQIDYKPKKKNTGEDLSVDSEMDSKSTPDTFDSEGSGYDYETAKKYGIEPDETGHWPSRVPETGQILKGTNHETFHKTAKGERDAGYEISKGNDGKYYSNPVETQPEGASVITARAGTSETPEGVSNIQGGEVSLATMAERSEALQEDPQTIEDYNLQYNPTSADLYDQYQESKKLTKEQAGDIQEYIDESPLKPSNVEDLRRQLTAEQAYKNQTDFAAGLSDYEKEDLKDFAVIKQGTMDAESINVQSENYHIRNSAIKSVDRIGGLAEKIGLLNEAYLEGADIDKDMVVGIMTEYNQEREKLENLNGEFNTNMAIINKNGGESADLDAEIDLLKRNYGWVENFTGKMINTGERLAVDSEEMAATLAEYIINFDAYGDDNVMDRRRAERTFARFRLDREMEGLRPQSSIEDVENAIDLGVWASEMISTQLPILAGMAAGGPAGLVTLTGAAGGAKVAELNERVASGELEMTEGEILTSGLIDFAFELLGEAVSYGIMSRGGRAIRSAQKGGNKKLFEKGIVKGLMDSPAVTTGIAASLEAGSEGFTQLGQNINEKYFVGNDEVGLMDGMWDAVAAGGLLGFLMGGSPQLAAQAIKGFRSQENAESFTKNSEEMKILIESAKNFPADSPMGEIIDAQMKSLAKDQATILQDDISTIEGMTEDQFNAVNELGKQSDKLQKYRALVDSNEDIDLPTKGTLISGIDSQIEAVENKKTAIINQVKADLQETRQYQIDNNTGSYEGMTDVEILEDQNRVAQAMYDRKQYLDFAKDSKEEGNTDMEEYYKRAHKEQLKIIEKNNKKIEILKAADTQVVAKPEVVAEESDTPVSPDTQTSEAYTETDVVEVTDAKQFSEAQDKAITKRTDDKLQVDILSQADAQKILDDGGKLFMTNDGQAGAYVKADGYMGGLFKDPTSTKNQAAKALQEVRVKAGGKFFDAYGTHLEDIYIENGFEPVARITFDETQAPEGWEKTNLKTKPDNVFFAYNPDGDYKKGDGVREEDYDAAYNIAKESDTRTGQQNEAFFTGKAAEASSKIPYKPVIKIDKKNPVARAYDKFSAGGNFTGHISKMIAGFQEKQIKVANAIVKGGFKNFLDLGTSEGGMIKTVASQDKSITAVGVDPNSQMKANFETTPEVKNAEFRQEAFQGSWVEEDGTQINEFKPTQKFDAVNEDFTFQFVNNDRSKQVKGVKEMMTPDGIFITSQKFIDTKNYDENEKKKYDHQRKYFNESELTEDKQSIVTGMAKDMVNDVDYFNTLKENFKYVEEFWNAGNFKGYIASDSRSVLDNFKKDVGNLDTEFTDTQSETRTTKPVKKDTKPAKKTKTQEAADVADRKATMKDVAKKMKDYKGPIKVGDITMEKVESGWKLSYPVRGEMKDFTSPTSKEAVTFFRNRLRIQSKLIKDATKEQTGKDQKVTKGKGKVTTKKPKAEQDKGKTKPDTREADKKPAEKSPIGKLRDGIAKLEKTNEHEQKIITNQAKKAIATIKKLFPRVKVKLRHTQKDYAETVGESNANSRGLYDPATQTVYINMSKADQSTVAHEIFHAVLSEKLQGLNVEQVSKRMLSSLKKVLPKNSDAAKDIARLEKVAKERYEAGVINEEVLAQVVGEMAANYTSYNTSTKAKIRAWVNSLAKRLGLDSIFKGATEDVEVVNFLNTLSDKLRRGTEVSENDIIAVSEGSSAPVDNPANIEGQDLTPKLQKVSVKEGGHKLSFVQKSDLIDIGALIKDIQAKNQKVWFWVGDQLGRGMYSDNEVNGEHYLDAGLSYALDPVNRKRRVIWASGKQKKSINNNIANSDYIFVVSGSPTASKLFNKQVFGLFAKRVGDFAAFKQGVMDSKPNKPIREALAKYDSWDAIMDNVDRKKLLVAIEGVKKLKSTPLKTFLEANNAFMDLNALRDGFLVDNNFELGDVMIVLKPEKAGDKSLHSTYETDLIGDVVGVPDSKVDSYDIMTRETKSRYKDLNAPQKQQVVAPYGSGIRAIEARQQKITDLSSSVQLEIAKAFEKEISKSKSLTKAIDAAMSVASKYYVTKSQTVKFLEEMSPDLFKQFDNLFTLRKDMSAAGNNAWNEALKVANDAVNEYSKTISNNEALIAKVVNIGVQSLRHDPWFQTIPQEDRSIALERFKKYTRVALTEALDEQQIEQKRISDIVDKKMVSPSNISKTFEIINRTLFSTMAPVEKLQRDLLKELKKEGITIPPNMDAVMAEVLQEGKSTKLIEDIQNEIWNLKNPRSFVSLLKKSGINYNDLGQYMIARHAPERNAKALKDLQEAKVILESDPQTAEDKLTKKETFEHLEDMLDVANQEQVIKEIDLRIKGLEAKTSAVYGMSDTDAAKILAKVEKSSKNDDYKFLADMYKERVSDAALELEYEAGMISDESYEALVNTYEYYTPLIVENKDSKPISDKRIGNAYSGIYHIKGDKFESIRKNPLEAGLNKYTSTAINSVKNKSAQVLLNLIDTHFSQSDMFNTLTDHEFMKLGNIEQNKHVSVKVGGKNVHIYIKDDILRQAIKGRVADDNFRHLAKPVILGSNFLRSVLTQFNVAFFTVNFFVDAQLSYLTLPKEVQKTIGPAAYANILRKSFAGQRNYKSKRSKGLPPTTQMGRNYGKLLEHGGVSRWGIQKDPKEIAKKLHETFNSIEDADVKNYFQTLLKTPAKGLLDGIDKAGEYFEHATRLAIFTASKNAGMTNDQAAINAKQGTLNFSAAGSWTPYLNTLFLFSNAGFQAAKVLAVVARKNPQGAMKILGAVAGMQFMSVIAIYMMGMGDEYEEESEYSKSHHMYLPIPFPGTNKPIKIKTPYGLNFVPYLGQKAATMAIDAAKNDNKWDQLPDDHYMKEALGTKYSPSLYQGAKISEAALRSIFEILNPIGDGLAPTAFRPIEDLISNKDFKGNRIYNESSGNMNEVDSQQGRLDTGEGYKSFVEGLNSVTGGTKNTKGVLDWHPESPRHIVKGYTGGIGTMFQTGVDKVKGEEDAQIPILRRFYSSDRNAAGTNEFFEMHKNAGAKYFSDKEFKKVEESFNRAMGEFRLDPMRIATMLEEIYDRQNEIVAFDKMNLSNSEAKGVDQRKEMMKKMMEDARAEEKKRKKEGN